MSASTSCGRASASVEDRGRSLCRRQSTRLETVGLAFHVMNGFDLPPGSIGVSATTGGEGGGVNGYETTEWTAVSDMKNLRYYIRTYDNFDVRMIDLSKADLNAKQIKFISLDKPQTVKGLMP